jgi:glycosyltransferase involved in cell wall biosynthesis
VSVAVIIPTIPGREALLEEAVASVQAQTVLADQIHIGLDSDHEGPATVRNRLIAQADTEWVAFLDDDDLWQPHHLETLLSHAQAADVVYPDCELTGNHPALLCNVDFNPQALEHGNYVPITVLLRRQAFHEAGGFDPDDRYEDWQLWRRLASLGKRFVHVPTVTWCYRFGADRQRTFA